MYIHERYCAYYIIYACTHNAPCFAENARHGTYFSSGAAYNSEACRIALMRVMIQNEKSRCDMDSLQIAPICAISNIMLHTDAFIGWLVCFVRIAAPLCMHVHTSEISDTGHACLFACSTKHHMCMQRKRVCGYIHGYIRGYVHGYIYIYICI